MVDDSDRAAVAIRHGLGVGSRGWVLPTTELRDDEDHVSAAQRELRSWGWLVDGPHIDLRLARWPSKSDVTTQVVRTRARRRLRSHPASAPLYWFDRPIVQGGLAAGRVRDAVSAAALYMWLHAGPAAERLVRS